MLLPIGSVVCVEGQKIVIAGYRPMLIKKRGTLGYVGLRYPYGYLSQEKVILFPAESVEKVVAIGYTGDEGCMPEDRKNELLPVGSVVMLDKTGKRCYMIAGYYPTNENMTGEYTVVPYPNGIIDVKEMGILAKSQIDQVLWYGYLDKEGEDVLWKIPDFMENASNIMKEFNDTIQFALKHVKGDKGEEYEISVDME